MKESDSSSPPSGTAEQSAVTELAMRRCVAARMRFWAVVAGLPVFLVIAYQTRELSKLKHELERLRAESVRIGQPVEIYNPSWGTVIDGVDPQRIPSRDARDPRFGALVQQFTPRGNAAQVWELRLPSTPTGGDMPLPERIYIKHAFSFLNARDFNRAIQSFEYCLKFYPDAAAAHSGLGVALRDKGDFPQALGSHDRAIELEPENPQFRWERAVTRLRGGDADGAIQDCEKATQLNPDFADAYNTMGIAWRQKRKLVEALTHHDHAVELNPQREDFWRERAATHQANGDQQKSAADTGRARQIREGRN
jgi:tetratricopeptide (TPR) repeat protein